jgi:hypothetical protein
MIVPASQHRHANARRQRGLTPMSSARVTRSLAAAPVGTAMSGGAAGG